MHTSAAIADPLLLRVKCEAQDGMSVSERRMRDTLHGWRERRREKARLWVKRLSWQTRGGWVK